MSSENSASSESSVQSSRKERKLAIVVNEEEVEAKQSSPRNEQAKAAAIITERQVKYLGLVIEKDEEQAIEVGDDLFMPADSVKRTYVPIREHYIRIVKSCRTLCINSMERRSRS